MPLRPDQFDAHGYLLLTRDEWRKKHRDFKSIRSDGTKVCNWLDPKTGATMSVPVRVVKELPPLTNPRRRKTMAKRRRTTHHRRDRRGRFLPRGRRTRRPRHPDRLRTTRVTARRAVRSGSSRSGSSSTRMLTLLGLGAAAIYLTKRMTAPAAAPAARIARNRNGASSPASPPMDAAQSTGPTLPDGTNV